MVLYHGSNMVVKQPKILQSERMLDFGAGFYTTPVKEQAVRWTEQIAKRREPKARILSIYEFDSALADRDLAIVRFVEPDGEWLDFISISASQDLRI